MGGSGARLEHYPVAVDSHILRARPVGQGGKTHGVGEMTYDQT